MNKNYIVVGGRAYADIDVLACVAAYTQLLTLKNYPAKGIITGPWNQTIPPTVRTWPIKIENTFLDSKDQCCFILVDVSDPKHLEDFVSLEDVTEVYDHHYGHELFWKERLSNASHIEHVGACATLIWEKFKEAGFQASISSTNANLLYTAIFANTLNFNSCVTTERDIRASEGLFCYTSLPSIWKETYYSEVAEGFLHDLSAHLRKDTKSIIFNGSNIHFGQVEMWNAAPIIDLFEHQFEPHPNEEWLINIASIEENRSYFYSNSARLREKMRHIAQANEMNRYFQISQRLWLRKEILRELYAQ